LNLSARRSLVLMLRQVENDHGDNSIGCAEAVVLLICF
jgi:hypothetical protein